MLLYLQGSYTSLQISRKVFIQRNPPSPVCLSVSNAIISRHCTFQYKPGFRCKTPSEFPTLGIFSVIFIEMALWRSCHQPSHQPNGAVPWNSIAAASGLLARLWLLSPDGWMGATLSLGRHCRYCCRCYGIGSLPWAPTHWSVPSGQLGLSWTRHCNSVMPFFVTTGHVYILLYSAVVMSIFASYGPFKVVSFKQTYVLKNMGEKSLRTALQANRMLRVQDKIVPYVPQKVLTIDTKHCQHINKKKCVNYTPYMCWTDILGIWRICVSCLMCLRYR